MTTGINAHQWDGGGTIDLPGTYISQHMAEWIAGEYLLDHNIDLIINVARCLASLSEPEELAAQTSRARELQ